ncbi:MAG: hypothetical protein EKK48_25860 [Candidatus Melainabacteria bacterium]|nr:MAG: hypothetical protein EKK48_25860 [Candidatus Melainabacteria bacterium]
MADILKLVEKPTGSDKTDNSIGINLVDLAQNGAENSDSGASAHSKGKQSAEVVTLPATSPDTYHLPTPDTLHLTRPQIDADLNRKYQPLNPGNWNNDSPLHDYYENGLLKLQGDPDGKRLFGIRISAQKNERIPFVPIGRQHLDEKGVALELRLKFP